MASIPGITEEEQERLEQANLIIAEINQSYDSVAESLGYSDNDRVTVSRRDLEVIMKYALSYEQQLMKFRNEGISKIESATPEPSFKI